MKSLPVTTVCCALCAEFPSELLAQRLRMAGRLLQFTLALVLLKAVGSASVWLQARPPCVALR